MLELSSAKAEATELSQSRLQQGLEAQITIETIRAECIDQATRTSRLIAALRTELAESRMNVSSLQSDTTLQELLKQSQEKWSLADAEVRTLRAARHSTAEEVADLRAQLSRGAESAGERSRRLEADLGRIRETLSSVQSELSAERTRGHRMQAEIRRERDELEAVEMALADAKA